MFTHHRGFTLSIRLVALTQLALERGRFALSPEAPLASSAGPPADHALAAFPSLASSGAASRPITGGSSSSGVVMSQSGATGPDGPTGRHGHVPGVRRVNMRALVATALEVASALRYLHDLVGGAGGLAAVHAAQRRTAVQAEGTVLRVHQTRYLLDA